MIVDYKANNINTIGKENEIKMIRYIGETNIDEIESGWIEVQNSNRVSVRWIFVTKLDKYNLVFYNPDNLLYNSNDIHMMVL